MPSSDNQNNGRRLVLSDGGRAGQARRRSIIRTPEEIELEERMRRAFRAANAPGGGAASRAVQEICEGRGRPFATAARRVLEMRAAGMTKDEAKQVAVRTWERWFDELPWNDQPLKPAA